jgi:FkbM family methyltransferase
MESLVKNAARSRTSSHRLLSKVIDECIRRARTALNINTKYQFNGFSIELPAEHLLPRYQKRHKLHERFLPHLGKYLAPGSTVVDVGANCGDTLAAMFASNKSLAFICIEPCEAFFEFLQKNVLLLRTYDKAASIKTVKALVGQHITRASLVGAGGTRRAVVDDSEVSAPSRSLDNILSQSGATHVRLLKSDVDGFDYDVIDSADSTLDAEAPIVFFECQLDYASQKAGYEKTIANIETKGYVKWVIFDNYGEVVLHTSDVRMINQLIDYLWRQNMGRSTRTIYYYDILAATKRDGALIDRVIEDYLTHFQKPLDNSPSRI